MSYVNLEDFYKEVRMLIAYLQSEKYEKAAYNLTAALHGSTGGEVLGALRYYLQGVVQYIDLPPQQDQLVKNLFSYSISVLANTPGRLNAPVREDIIDA